MFFKEHSFADSTINRFDYETAHAIADSKHNWWAAIETEEG